MVKVIRKGEVRMEDCKERHGKKKGMGHKLRSNAAWGVLRPENT